LAAKSKSVRQAKEGQAALGKIQDTMALLSHR